MSNPKRILHFSIVEYFNALKSDSNYDTESVDVILGLLQELFNVRPDDAEHRLEAHSVTKGRALLDIFQTGLATSAPAAAAANASPAPTSAVSAEMSAEEKQRFDKFVQFLSGQGFFGEAKPGSAEYDAKIELARSKFRNKHPKPVTSSSSSSSPSPTPMAVDEKSAPASAPAPAPSEADKKEAERFKETGNKLLAEGQYQAAITCYSEAIKLNPNSAVYYANRAHSSIQLKRFQDAVQDSELAVQVDPKYYKAWYRMGVAQAQLQKYEQAVKAFEKALETIDPKGERQPIELQLQSARAKLGQDATFANPFAALASQMGAGGMDFRNFDFNSILQNPAIMNQVQSVMQNMGLNPNNMPFPPSAAAAAAAPAPAAGAAPAAAAAASPFGGMLEKLMTNPDFAALKNDPDFAAVINDVQQDPNAAFSKVMSNPQLMSKFGSLLTPLLSGGAKPPQPPSK